MRNATYRGRHIVIRTRYEIRLDGELLGTHVSVADDGSVHCHGLPNHAFASMLDLVRKIIDESDPALPQDDLSTVKED